MSVLPLFYYPTTVAWVDDDELFLQVATDILLEPTKVKAFSSALTCFDFFSTYISYLSQIPFLHGKTDDEKYDTINHLPVDINTGSFIHLPNDAGRKNEICVLVVDYNMPNMTGIELCRKLKNIPVKKILLTGESDNAHAIAAFNEGIIDCYIQKHSETLVNEVRDYIKLLSLRYFYDQSKALLSHLETDRKIPLSDRAFISFFNNWCSTNQIEEYYIFDKNGNLQLIDKDRNKILFIIHTDYTLNEFIELNQDNKNVCEYIEAVRQRTKVPFFGIGKDSWQVETKDWSQHFYPLQILEGREKYYWFIKKL